MKKTRLLVLMLALALLVCGAIGITASAENEPALTLKKNVSFVDTPSLVFAVEGVEAEADVELRVYASAEATEYYTATAIEGGVVIDEVEYPAFYLAGIYPKDIANEVYVKAVSGDKESAMLRYSILEFALEGIDTYKGVNDELAAFYQNIIDYSSGIQKYLGDKFVGVNAADYNYVKVEDGTIGGYSTAVLADGEYEVTLTGSAPAGLTHVGWTVGSTEFTGNTVTISESCTVTPKYQASVVTLQPGEKFDDGRVVDAASGYITNSSGTNTRIRYYKTNSGTAGLQSGDAIEIVNDPANSGNKVLKFTDGSTESYTSVHIQASPDYAEYSSDNKDNKGVKTTFETLLYIEEYPELSFTNNQTVAQPMFTQSGRSTALQFNITYSTEKGKFYFAPTSTGAVMTTLFTDSNYFSANEWVAIRFEWYQYDLRAEQDAIIKLYINNVHAANITPPTAMLEASGTSGESLHGTKDVDHMMWKGFSTSRAVMYFDNLSIYDAYIDQTIVETPAE